MSISDLRSRTGSGTKIPPVRSPPLNRRSFLFGLRKDDFCRAPSGQRGIFVIRVGSQSFKLAAALVFRRDPESPNFSRVSVDFSDLLLKVEFYEGAFFRLTAPISRVSSSLLYHFFSSSGSHDEHPTAPSFNGFSMRTLGSFYKTLNGRYSCTRLPDGIASYRMWQRSAPFFFLTIRLFQHFFCDAPSLFVAEESSISASQRR